MTANSAHDKHFQPPWTWGAVLEGGHSSLAGKQTKDWARLLLGMRGVLRSSFLSWVGRQQRPGYPRTSRLQEPLAPPSPSYPWSQGSLVDWSQELWQACLS